MSDRKPSVYIKDILKCISHIELYTDNLSFDEFSSNYLVIEACLYNIQVIGEAISKLPADIKQKENQIPWPLIKGMRNRLIHDYFGTDLNIVWHVIRNELPTFGNDLRKLQAELIRNNS